LVSLVTTVYQFVKKRGRKEIEPAVSVEKLRD
jgi:hypothetical protein